MRTLERHANYEGLRDLRIPKRLFYLLIQLFPYLKCIFEQYHNIPSKFRYRLLLLFWNPALRRPYTVMEAATSSVAMESSLPMEINVISLNCWGLKFLSKFHEERLQEIGRRIAATDPAPQIVGLQECWTQKDYRAIRAETKHILPYGKFYYSGIFGGGLAILSKWPIEEGSMLRYPLNGRPTAFFRGDWYVGKGVASARIRYGSGEKDVIEVFTTHVGNLC